MFLPISFLSLQNQIASNMLLSLWVKNYTLIDEIRLIFSPNLNIITGETGAGKSILLGAVGLILGQRADQKIFYNQEEKCVIEAEFDIKNLGLQHWFVDQNIEYQDIAILRRELQANGRNRIFINDDLVSLSQMQDIATRMVDIHQQFSIFDIQKPAYQLQLFDAYCNNKNLVEDFKIDFQQYSKLLIEKIELENHKHISKKEFEYIQYQLADFSNVNLDEVNQEKLENELEMQENAQAIQQNFSMAYNELVESESAILSSLKQIKNQISPYKKMSNDIKELDERFESCLIELTELGKDFINLADKVELDNEKAEKIKNILDVIYRLQQKFNVQDIASLIEIKNQFELKISGISNIDEDIEKNQKRINELQQLLHHKSNLLSQNRNKFKKEFEESIVNVLILLGMPHAIFEIKISLLEEWNSSGKEQVEIYFAANKGFSPAPIRQVASGGEISRLTLAIKSQVASAIPLPTMIFDEIDTGLGGEIALKMAEILKSLSLQHQLIVITHSPQIAAKGNKHLYVYKENNKEKTNTGIIELTLEQKIENIAIMLSTKPPSKAAIENAKELINQ